MQPYQEEYIANAKEFKALTMKRLPEDTSFSDYTARLERLRARKEMLARRNTELLRGELMPALDGLPDADERTLAELGEYAGQLYNGRVNLDVEQFCVIHRSLLSLARQRNDRTGIIRELYWLGIGRHAIYNNKVSGMSDEHVAPYMIPMRLCFAEAAAYLKYFDEIKDSETRSFIMRSLANSAMGVFASVSERIRLLQHALQVFRDTYYREQEPGLPWDRYARQTHMLMVSSLPHGNTRAMTPQDVSEIMESAHIIYHDRAVAAEQRGEPLPAQQVFRTAAIDYFCGVCDLDAFFAIMEKQMDAADIGSFESENMYRLISLPAFYCVYLSKYPDYIPPREDYLAGLYQRIADYMDSFPKDREVEQLFLYLRQLSSSFVEAEHAIPYGEFLSRMLSRFAPEIYIHSCQVAAAAEALCGIIMDEEPDYFDDIDFLRGIPDLTEKREAVLAYARGCGWFHDVGKVSFMDLYTLTARQWMEEEYEMSRLHTVKGAVMLSERNSTSRYAAAALGHHAWYDGSRGYPAGYKRLEYPERQMVDVIALMDWLSETSDTGHMRRGKSMTFDESVKAAVALEGRRFSPLLTARLRDSRVVRRVKAALETGRQEAYWALYKW